MIMSRILSKILDDENIEKGSELEAYIANSFLFKVYILNEDKCEVVRELLKNLEYDTEALKSLVECAYWIRNSMSKTKESRSKPSLDYLFAVKEIFEALGMDYKTYNTHYIPANHAIDKLIYSQMNYGGDLNGERKLVDVAKKILDAYYIEEDPNMSATKVLAVLNKIDSGFRRIKESYNGVSASEEFYSLFEVTDKIVHLYFADIIEEFYPKFQNELFVYIKKFVQSEKEAVSTEEIIKYLRNIEETKVIFTNCKVNVRGEIAKIDLKVKEGVEKAFSTLMNSVRYNELLDVSTKSKIMEVIENKFNQYKNMQDKVIDEKLEYFFSNCVEHLDTISEYHSRAETSVDGLILSLLEESKDFFIECDSRKFKEIVNFITENTSVNQSDLKKIGKVCAKLFKEGDIEKLKAIKDSLADFRKYVNNKFSNESYDDNLFELILLENPQFLTQENNVDEILAILKGEKTFKINGYTGEEVQLNKDFLSYGFYKRIMEDNYSLLFNGGVKTLESNLTYLSSLCKQCDINMKFLNVNEDLLYSLLNDDLYSKGTNVLAGLKTIVGSDNVKFILEKNPHLTGLSKEHLSLIIKNSILNSNAEYNFFDLLFSQLYDYSKEKYKDIQLDEGATFKYYDLGIDTSELTLDIEEIITSDIITDVDISLFEQSYNIRNEKIKKLDGLVATFSTSKEFNLEDSAEFRNIISLYRELYAIVPYHNIRDLLFSIIDEKKHHLEQRYAEIDEIFNEKEKVMSAYKAEMQEAEYVNEKLEEILKSVASEETKQDLKEVSKKIYAKRVIDNKRKIQEAKEFVGGMKKDLELVESKIQKLSLAFAQVEFLDDYDIDSQYVSKKSFCFNDVIKNETEYNETSTIDLDNNVVLFADNIDLNTKEFLDDRDCVDKLYKFLVDEKFSLKSVEYMSDSSLNTDGVEKYRDQREKLWSRRESRTPVRVYYIPIYTKYFTVYYTVNIEKENVHLDGGMSDSVYKKHVSDSEKILKKINSMTQKEALDYVKQAQENYDEKVSILIKRKNRR